MDLEKIKNSIRPWHLLVVILVIIVVVGIGISVGGSGDKDGVGLSDDKVRVQTEGGTIDVYKNGNMVFNRSDGDSFEQRWVGENGETPYDYFLSIINTGDYSTLIVEGCTVITYVNEQGEEMRICVRPSNETDAITDELNDGDSGGGESGGSGGSGDDDGDDPFGGLFGTPTPTPIGGGSSGSDDDGDDGETGGSPGGGPDDCPFWRLSYCVYPRTSTPTPTPTFGPVPTGILPPNCEENTFSGRTVISNELCISSPTPSP